MAGAAVIQFWQFFVTVGVVAAIGSGAAATPVAATVATRWFETRRGLVLGISGAGMAAGQLVVLPLAMGLVAVLGWRDTYFVLGVGLIVLVVPLPAALISNDPTERGLRPFGATGSSSRPAAPPRPPRSGPAVARPCARGRSCFCAAASGCAGTRRSA